MKTDRLQGILMLAPKIPHIIEDIRPQKRYSDHSRRIIQDFTHKQSLPQPVNNARHMNLTTTAKVTNQLATDLALRLGLHS